MQLPPEVNLIAVAHYLQALECQRDANRVVALLGGKSPHIQNPGGRWGGEPDQSRQHRYVEP